MRRHFTFPCEDAQLVATLDEGDAATGLLIVTGGNEVRAGAWAGQAQFAARIAAHGHPVLRFDRRGCGDSEGANAAFRGSAADIVAALDAFRTECPQLSRIVAMGNCDAASALMLGSGLGADGLILTNPWTFEDDGGSDAAPEALRDHYRGRLGDWRAIRRVLSGKVALGPLMRSLIAAARPAASPSSLLQQMAAGMAGFGGSVRFLVAGRDRTGRAFLSAWPQDDLRIRHVPAATHSFVEEDARERLVAETINILQEIG